MPRSKRTGTVERRASASTRTSPSDSSKPGVLASDRSRVCTGASPGRSSTPREGDENAAPSGTRSDDVAPAASDVYRSSKPSMRPCTVTRNVPPRRTSASSPATPIHCACTDDGRATARARPAARSERARDGRGRRGTASGAGVDGGRSGSARLRRAPRSKHTTAPVSIAPPPSVPWQFTGNHWLTLPCIHPADGGIHAVGVLHRGARAAVEFAGAPDFLAGGGPALLRPFVELDGGRRELAAEGVAWE